MRELSKANIRRYSDPRFAERWFRGEALDIGSGDDPLDVGMFPKLTYVRNYDKIDGDALTLDGVADESFDVVHSSHCLEHLTDTAQALNNWIRVCKSGGHLIITVPDEDLYEQGAWPSTFNTDHKFTFTIGKQSSWSPVSVNVLGLLGMFTDRVRVLKVELLDAAFDYNKPRQDQTLGESESGIEIVLEKL